MRRRTASTTTDECLPKWQYCCRGGRWIRRTRCRKRSALYSGNVRGPNVSSKSNVERAGCCGGRSWPTGSSMVDSVIAMGCFEAVSLMSSSFSFPVSPFDVALSFSSARTSSWSAPTRCSCQYSSNTSTLMLSCANVLSGADISTLLKPRLRLMDTLGHRLQIRGMQPAATQSAMTQRSQHSHGDKVGISICLRALRPAEGAQSGVFSMYKVSLHDTSATLKEYCSV